jgi:hypothetical protein
MLVQIWPLSLDFVRILFSTATLSSPSISSSLANLVALILIYLHLLSLSHACLLFSSRSAARSLFLTVPVCAVCLLENSHTRNAKCCRVEYRVEKMVFPVRGEAFT